MNLSDSGSDEEVKKPKRMSMDMDDSDEEAKHSSSVYTVTFEAGSLGLLLGPTHDESSSHKLVVDGTKDGTQARR